MTDTHIGVAVEKGVVTLSGHVPSYGEKSAAERDEAGRAAWGAPGVTAVTNHITVTA